MRELTETYLKADDYNVIHVDWSKLAAQTAAIAVAYANDVGKRIAKSLKFLNTKSFLIIRILWSKINT